MKTYQSYSPYTFLRRESLPSHWSILPMYAVAREKSICNCSDLPLLSVYLDSGVIPFESRTEKRTNTTSKDLTNYQRVDIGDFVLNNQQAWRGSVGISFYTGIVSPAYVVLDVTGNLESRFANYLLRSRIMVDQYLVYSKSIGSIQRNIHWSSIKRIKIPVPPIDEQEQIVSFLDWKTSAINRIIYNRQREIALLDEKERTFISNVVTRGTNITAILSDSGIDWLGEIPSHWETARCKTLFIERDERSKDGREEHLSMSQKFGLVSESLLGEKRLLSLSYVGGKICYKDDLVLNRLKAHLGVFALAPQMGVISPDYTVLIPNKERIIPAFAETTLKSLKCRRELRIRVRGIVEGFWRLYTDDFGTIVLPVPPLTEQQEIMSHISDYLQSTKRYRT